MRTAGCITVNPLASRYARWTAPPIQQRQAGWKRWRTARGHAALVGWRGSAHRWLGRWGSAVGVREAAGCFAVHRQRLDLLRTGHTAGAHRTHQDSSTGGVLGAQRPAPASHHTTRRQQLLPSQTGQVGDVRKKEPVRLGRGLRSAMYAGIPQPAPTSSPGDRSPCKQGQCRP